MNSWLDRLPAWARHVVIAASATFGGSVCAAVVAAHGFSSLDFPAVLLDSADNAVFATAGIAAALWFTPLTEQYGRVSKKTREAEIGS